MKKITFQDIIIFENDNYIVINKPVGIASLTERDTSRNSILTLAKNHDKNLQLCHRLDKETTGVLAIAKNPEAYRNLSIQFEKRKTKKIYHAVTNGIQEMTDRLVNYRIAVSSKRNVRIDSVEGKKSETIFNTLKIYKKNTLIECELLTGRMHQIRIHLAAIKAPIVGDILYGGVYLYLSEIKRKFKLKNNTEELPLIKRVALHAFRLEFKDIDGEPIVVEADYPKDMKGFLRQLEKNV